jgi:hypothetical protein
VPGVLDSVGTVLRECGGSQNGQELGNCCGGETLGRNGGTIHIVDSQEWGEDVCVGGCHERVAQIRSLVNL